MELPGLREKSALVELVEQRELIKSSRMQIPGHSFLLILQNSMMEEAANARELFGTPFSPRR